MNREHGQQSYREWHVTPKKGVIYDQQLYGTGHYDAAVWEIERCVLKQVIKIYFPRGIDRYLDFACGTARIFGEIMGAARYRVGIDVSAEMLAVAQKKHPGESFIRGDITINSKFREGLGCFDFVTAFRFFLNAEPELRLNAIKALSDVVTPGGYLVCNNHGNYSSMLMPVLAVRKLIGLPRQNALKCGELCNILEQHGFHIVKVIGVCWWPRITFRLIPEILWRAMERTTASIPGIERMAIYQIVVAQRI